MKSSIVAKKCFSLENDYPSFGSASLENDNITLQSGALHSIKSMFFVFHCNVTLFIPPTYRNFMRLFGVRDGG